MGFKFKNKKSKKTKEEQEYEDFVDKVLAVYEMLDDDDISTQRLLMMVADTCDCEVDDVVDALIYDGGTD